MAQTEAVRLYVGGLPADITAEAIAQRFAPFGKVISSELVPAKCSGIGIASQPGTCRGFAYVSLQPKDATSVSRCLSLYNHSKWRGHTLRVELAKPHYLARLEDEWRADEEAAASGTLHLQRRASASKRKKPGAQESATDQASEDADILEYWDGVPRPLDESRPLVLALGRKKQRLQTLEVELRRDRVAQRVKSSFPFAPPLPLTRINWESSDTQCGRHLHHLNYLWDHRVELTQPRTQHITQPHDTDNNPDTAGVPDSVREAVEPPGQQSGAHTGAPEAVQASMAAAQKVTTTSTTGPSKEALSYLKLIKSISHANDKQEASAAAAAAVRAASKTAKADAARASKRTSGPTIAPLALPRAAAASGAAAAVVSFAHEDDDGDGYAYAAGASSGGGHVAARAAGRDTDVDAALRAFESDSDEEYFRDVKGGLATLAHDSDNTSDRGEPLVHNSDDTNSDALSGRDSQGGVDSGDRAGGSGRGGLQSQPVAVQTVGASMAAGTRLQQAGTSKAAATAAIGSQAVPAATSSAQKRQRLATAARAAAVPAAPALQPAPVSQPPCPSHSQDGGDGSKRHAAHTTDQPHNSEHNTNTSSQSDDPDTQDTNATDDPVYYDRFGGPKVKKRLHGSAWEVNGSLPHVSEGAEGGYDTSDTGEPGPSPASNGDAGGGKIRGRDRQAEGGAGTGGLSVGGARAHKGMGVHDGEGPGTKGKGQGFSRVAGRPGRIDTPAAAAAAAAPAQPQSGQQRQPVASARKSSAAVSAQAPAVGSSGRSAQDQLLGGPRAPPAVVGSARPQRRGPAAVAAAAAAFADDSSGDEVFVDVDTDGDEDTHRQHTSHVQPEPSARLGGAQRLSSRGKQVATQHTTQPTTQPTIQPATQPATQPTTQPTAQPTMQRNKAVTKVGPSAREAGSKQPPLALPHDPHTAQPSQPPQQQSLRSVAAVAAAAAVAAPVQVSAVLAVPAAPQAFAFSFALPDAVPMREPAAQATELVGTQLAQPETLALPARTHTTHASLNAAARSGGGCAEPGASQHTARIAAGDDATVRAGEPAGQHTVVHVQARSGLSSKGRASATTDVLRKTGLTFAASFMRTQ